MFPLNGTCHQQLRTHRGKIEEERIGERYFQGRCLSTLEGNLANDVLSIASFDEVQPLVIAD